MKVLTYLLAILSIVTSNIWDNIFSQTLSQSPINFLHDFNVEFKQPNNEVTINVDFNAKLQILTITASKQAFIISIPLAKVQIDTKTLIVSFQSILKPEGCQRYQLEAIKTKINEDNLKKYDSSVANLLVVLFKYIGNTSQNEQMWQLRLDLLISHTKQHGIQPRPVLISDSNGNILKVYQSKNMEYQIPFKTKSSIKKKIRCSTDIQVISNQQLKDLIDQALKYRDQKDLQDLKDSKFEDFGKMSQIDFNFPKFP